MPRSGAARSAIRPRSICRSFSAIASNSNSRMNFETAQHPKGFKSGCSDHHDEKTGFGRGLRHRDVSDFGIPGAADDRDSADLLQGSVPAEPGKRARRQADLVPDQEPRRQALEFENTS